MSIIAKKSRELHADRMKAIRKYVDFDVDLRKPLTNYEKRKIKKYHDALYGPTGLTKTHAQIYHPRRADHLKAAKEYVGGKNMLPGLKVAFLPAGPEGQRARVRFLKDGSLEMQTEHVTRITIPIDNMRFAENPYMYTQEIVDAHPSFKYFSLIMRNYEITTSWPRSRFAEAMREYALRGASGKGVVEQYAQEFAAYKFRNQTDYETYIRDRRAAQKEKYRDNQKKKDRERKRRTRVSKYATAKGRA